MNKLLTKIVGAVLGASMAVGVGVGVAINNDRKDFNSEVEAAASSITFTTSASNLNYSSGTASNKSMTVSGVTITFSSITGKTNSPARVQAAKNSTITSTVFADSITSITLNDCAHTGSKSDGSFTVSCSANGSSWTEVYSTSTMSPSQGNVPITGIASGYKYFKVTVGDSRVLQLSGIVVNYGSGSTPLTGITLGGAASQNALSIGSSDLTAKTVSVTLNPSGATDQKVNIAHQSGTSGLFTVSSSATCTSGSGSFTVTGKGNTSGSETFRISGNTETSVYVDLVVTALDDSAPKYTVTYVHGDHGTGDNYVVNNVPSGSYTLATFATAGFTASSGYAFKKWSIDDVEYAEGASVTISDDTTVTAIYKTAVQYSLYTIASGEIDDGDYVVYDATDGVALKNELASNTNYIGYDSSVTPVSNKITDPDASIIWHIEKSGSYWTVYNSSAEKYAASTGAKNKGQLLADGTDDKSLWTISGTSTFEFVNKQNTTNNVNANLRHNSGYGFACYSTSTGHAITLYKAPSNELSSIALSGDYKTSFNSGDTFSFGGTVTASYTIASAANVTSGTTFHLDSASGTNMSGVTMTHAAHDGHTIYAKYTEGGITKTATYAISVANAPVSSLTLGSSTGKVALNEYFDMSEIGVTILPVDAVQTYEWTVLSNTVNDDYEFDADIVAAKDTAGTITLKCTSTADSTKYQTFVLTVSGSPVVTLPNSISLFTGKTTTVTVSVEGGTSPYSYSWSITSGGSYASISSGGSSATVTLSGTAAGSVTLQCTVTDSNSKSDSASVTFSVVASAVTSVSWSASAFDVFSGATIPSNIDDTWEVNYEKNNGDADYLTFGDYELYLGSKEITSLPYTFVAADDGKTLHVEYGGVSSSSVAVTVTQTINTVMVSTTNDWDYTFTAKQFLQNDGETEVTLDGKDWVANGTGGYWGYDGTKGQQFGSGSSANTSLTLTSSDFDGTVDSVTVYTSGAKDIVGTVQVSVGGTAYGDAETLTSTNTGYTFDLGGKSGDVVISYTQTSSKAIYIKEIVVNTVSGSTNIANNASHKAAQRVAVKFANAFNAAMDETENCTKGLDTAWSTCSSAYNTFKSEAAALGSTEEAYAKNLIKYATAQYSDDSGEACIERMMKTYEVCVQKHGKTAFMSDLKTIEPANGLLNPISGNNVVTTVTVIISVLSLTTLGGYFLLRKRKEEN